MVAPKFGSLYLSVKFGCYGCFFGCSGSFFGSTGLGGTTIGTTGRVLGVVEGAPGMVVEVSDFENSDELKIEFGAAVKDKLGPEDETIELV